MVLLSIDTLTGRKAWPIARANLGLLIYPPPCQCRSSPERGSRTQFSSHTPGFLNHYYLGCLSITHCPLRFRSASGGAGRSYPRRWIVKSALPAALAGRFHEPVKLNPLCMSPLMTRRPTDFAVPCWQRIPSSVLGNSRAHSISD